MPKHKEHFETIAVHAGASSERPSYTPSVPPIHTATSYVYDTMQEIDDVFEGKSSGYVYARYGNPTVVAFESAVAALEGAESATAYASGMAAVHAALLAAGAYQGATVLCAADVYGATYKLLAQLFTHQGVTTHFTDFADHEGVAKACEELHPVALLCETISNPLLKVADLPALAKMAHSAGATLIVDNTFASPYLCRPLEQGGDYCVHSATKYIGGHGDLMGGVVACSAERAAELGNLQKLLGANLDPFQAWLGMRGIRTLALRVERQCRNAAQIAPWLEQHTRVARVYYPGLAAHPQHELASHLLAHGLYGAMLAFDLKDADKTHVFRFMDALTLVLPGTTLGDVQSLTLYPAHASHRALPRSERHALGIGDGLVRLSVGIEDPEDIMADLDQALMSAF